MTEPKDARTVVGLSLAGLTNASGNPLDADGTSLTPPAAVPEKPEPVPTPRYEPPSLARGWTPGELLRRLKGA